MPDDSPQLAPATVDAFLGAPEAKQREALGKMSIPAKQALLGELKKRKAAGTLKTGSSSTQPTASPTPPTPSTSANPFIVPGEGIYQMHDKAGKPVPVSYSKVEDARSQGHRFADQKTLEQYGRDFVADPNKQGGLPTWQQEHPILGFIPRVFEGFGGSLEVGLAAADRLISKASGEGTIEPLQLSAAKAGAMQGVPEFLGATGEQIAELLVGEGEARALLKGTGLAGKVSRTAARMKELTTVLDKYPKAKALFGLGMKAATSPGGKLATRAMASGGEAATEQGVQEFVRSGGDTEATRQTMEQAGGVGAALPIVGAALPVGKFVRWVLRNHMNIDEYVTDKLVKEVSTYNQAIREELRRARVKGESDLAAAESTADAERIRHNNLLLDQHATEAQRLNLSDALERTRQVVYSRLRNMRSAARAYFGQAYGDIEKAGGGKGVELETLVNDAEEAREQHVKGSEDKDSLKVFNDLKNRFNHPKVDLSEPPNSDFTKEEWTSFSKEDREHAWKDAMEEGGTSSTISLKNLNGYYSELGRVVASETTPGDIKDAAKALQKAIDDRILETYGEDLFKRNQLVRSQYREFAGQFLDADSPVAKAVDAPDYYHGTQSSFLTADARQPAVRTRVKTMLIGDAKDPSTQFLGKDIHENYARDPETGKMIGSGEATPSWRYRRQTHQLIEDMRNLHAKLNALPKPKVMEARASVSGRAANKAQEAARTAGVPEGIVRDETKTLTPEELRQKKADTMLDIAHNFGKFGKWVAIGGLVGGASGFLHAITTGKGMGGAVEEAGGGVVMGMVTPVILSKMLMQPGVVNSLTRLSRGDLEKLAKLPPAQRGPTEDLIKMLADEAVREGKLKEGQIPWLRVLAGTAARKRVEAGRQEEQGVGTELDDLEKLNNDLETPAPSSQSAAAAQGVQP